MATTIQLPQDIQSALDSADSRFAGSQNGPEIPGTSMPIAPTTEQPAPAAPQLQNDAGTVDAIASSYFSHLLQNQPARPQNPSAGPGGFAAKLSAALGNVNASLGDASHATDNLRPGEGGASGVANTLAARNERLSKQKQQNFENNLASKRDARDSALNSMQMALHAKQLEAYDEAARQKVYSSNASTVKSREDQGFSVERGVTENSLQERMKKDLPDGKHFTDVFDILPEGEAEVNGQKVKTYSLVEKSSKPVKPSDDELNFIKANGGPDLPTGTALPENTLIGLRLNAQRVATATHAIEAANAQALDDKQKTMLKNDLASSAVQHALAQNPADPISAIQQAGQVAQDHVNHGQQLLQAAQQHGDPNAIQEAQQYLDGANKELKSLQNVAAYGFSENAIKEHEQARHNRAEEQNKAEELRQKKSQALTSNLTGEDYLKTLPVGQQSVVRAVGEGRQALPANRKEALAILEHVHQAYSDFDEAKVKSWQKAVNEYNGSGKTAQSLVRANTAMAHAKALYDETTADAVLNPFSKAHQDREITLGLLKDEIGAAVKGGVVTEGEGKDLFDRLGGGLTVGAKRERIAEVTRRLHDRIEEQQTKFASAAPSSATKVPSLMSPQAASAYDYVQSGGKLQPQQSSQSSQPNQQQQPPAQSQGHKVGDQIVQNGRTFIVTSVDPATGKVTGAK